MKKLLVALVLALAVLGGTGVVSVSTAPSAFAQPGVMVLSKYSLPGGPPGIYISADIRNGHKGGASYRPTPLMSSSVS
jgi:hypothetical protein